MPPTIIHLHFKSSVLFSADVMLGGMSDISATEYNTLICLEAKKTIEKSILKNGISNDYHLGLFTGVEDD